MKIRVHVNKHIIEKGGDNIWSLITSKACYHVKHVNFGVPLQTEYRKNSKRNPKVFLVAQGNITIKDGIAFIHS